jgi:hypothetical protein
MRDGVECTLVENLDGEIGLLDRAREVGEALQEAYPGHLWCIYFHDRTMVIKNMAISPYYGMCLDDADLFSAKILKEAAIRSGGELLERAGMRRGKWDGSEAPHLEGEDPRFNRRNS